MAPTSCGLPGRLSRADHRDLSFVADGLATAVAAMTLYFWPSSDAVARALIFIALVAITVGGMMRRRGAGRDKPTHGTSVVRALRTATL